MSFLTHWFRRGKSEDYETILSGLAADVQKRQTRLAEIRLRERRTLLQFTLGTFLVWFSYASLWYTRTLPSTWYESNFGTAGMVTGPVLILFARRMMQIWYSWKGNREESTLKEVLKKQRETVEEIKKKTNYESTRNLIEKYDESSPLSPGATPLRRRNISPSVPPTPLAPQPPPQPHLLQTPNGQIRGPVLQISPIPQPIQAARKHWYDKLADAVLGDDDEQSATFAASRYALICQKCFAHNGLVKENVWEETQYVCPKCGFFNPSARSKKQAAQRTPSPPSFHQTPQRSSPPPNTAQGKQSSSEAQHVEGDDTCTLNDSPIPNLAM